MFENLVEALVARRKAVIAYNRAAGNSRITLQNLINEETLDSHMGGLADVSKANQEHEKACAFAADQYANLKDVRKKFPVLPAFLRARTV
jgi:hypothetical protein